MIVYKIINKINNKMYIGCTSQSLSRRWKQHLNINNGKKTTIRRALDKYGRDNFYIEKIEECQNEIEMFKREIYWISFYSSNKSGIGYNMTIGGDSGPVMRGKNHPNFGKKSVNPNWQKIIHREREMTEEHKKKFYASTVGKPKSDGHKKRISDKVLDFYKKNKYNQESKDKISASNKGRISHRRVLVLCLNNYKIYDSYQEAANALGVSAGNIPQVVNGKYSHTKGFKFQKVTAEHLIF